MTFATGTVGLEMSTQSRIALRTPTRAPDRECRREQPKSPKSREATVDNADIGFMPASHGASGAALQYPLRCVRGPCRAPRAPVLPWPRMPMCTAGLTTQAETGLTRFLGTSGSSQLMVLGWP